MTTYGEDAALETVLSSYATRLFRKLRSSDGAGDVKESHEPHSDAGARQGGVRVVG